MIFKKDLITIHPELVSSDVSNACYVLSTEQQVVLLAEQALIERMCCLQEIHALRVLLQENGIDAEHIPDWVQRSDNILDTLLRYKLGKCGQLLKKNMLIMPYSWRRKFRKRYP